MSNGMKKKLAGAVGRLLLAYTLVFAQSVWAGQEQKATDSPKPAQKAAAQQTGEKPSSAASAAKPKSEELRGEVSEKAAAEEKSSGDGKHEGIKVHGHWTIEVRDANGALVKHVEFENSLSSSQVPTGLLFGSSVPGGFRVTLGSDSSGSVGPCPANSNITTSCFLVGSLTNPTPSGFSDQAAGCPGGANCSPLNVATNSNGSILSLAGTATAASSGQITDVFTFILVCGRNFSPQTCSAATTETLNTFTHATLSPAVNVAAGQTIAVTVSISFS